MKPTVDLSTLRSGDKLPDFVLPAITRHTLAVYCGASGDHNPLHVDIDFAKNAGLDDVIAHGMLIMGYCSRALLNWVPQTAIREFDTRFRAMTHVGDVITIRTEILELVNNDSEKLMQLGFAAVNQHDDVKTTGTALIGLNGGI